MYTTRYHSGSVSRVLDWGWKGCQLASLRLTGVTVLCPSSKTLYPLFDAGSTQEKRKLCGHDRKRLGRKASTQTKPQDASSDPIIFHNFIPLYVQLGSSSLATHYAGYARA